MPYNKDCFTNFLILFEGPLNYEDEDFYVVQVESDNSDKPFSFNILVSVGPHNEHTPVFSTPSASVTISEDETFGSSIIQVYINTFYMPVLKAN